MARWLVLKRGEPHTPAVLETRPDEDGHEVDLKEEFEVLQYYYNRWYRRLQVWQEPPVWEPVPGYCVPLADVELVVHVEDF